MIEVGARLPEAPLYEKNADGPVQVPSNEVFAGKRVVLIGMPGAYTPTCQAKHIPGYVKKAAEIKAKGIDEIVLVAVNDPHVMTAWGQSTGATAAGIRMMGDSTGKLARDMGVDFTAEPVGMIGRMSRFVAVVEDGVVTDFLLEKLRSDVEVTGADALLARL